MVPQATTIVEDQNVAVLIVSMCVHCIKVMISNGDVFCCIR